MGVTGHGVGWALLLGQRAAGRQRDRSGYKREA
jgi:hypothetical protein